MPLPNSLQAVLTEDWRNGGFGLYVHWPFCEAKCPYCDFNSHVSRKIDQDAWARAYISELERVGRLTQGRVLNSIFFGGGTPSLILPSTVAQVIETASRIWSFANDIEITLEANPSSVEADKFKAFNEGGVNRVSLGIQALNDGDLRRLGRLHTLEEALEALSVARSTFDRVSFDLIYARQDQSLDSWAKELSTALSYQPNHLSLYQLTIEPNTAFGDRYKAGGLKGLPSDDISADMYELTQDLTEAAGLPTYEVSNHAKTGQTSIHNMIYWQYGDYAGIGPGAHGRLTVDGKRFATETYSNPDKWLSLALNSSGEKQPAIISTAEQVTEFLLMGLRTTRGVDLARFETLSGEAISEQAVEEMTGLDLIRRSGQTVAATRQGMMLLNSVIEKLLPT